MLFSGHVHDARLTYFIQIDGDNADRTFLNFKDYYLQYKFHDELSLRLGKWKARFAKQERLSALHLQLVDRSMANEFFNIDRALGFGLLGKRNGIWFYEAAVINGFDAEDSRSNRRGDLDSNPGEAARFYIEPWAASTTSSKGQDLKRSFTVLRLNGAPLSSEDGEFRAGDHGLLSLTQLQWLF